MSKRKKKRQNPESQPATRQADFVAPEQQPTQAIVMSESWSGPFPPPAVIEKYEDMVPGAADRILKMTENQTAHRIQMEKMVIRGDSIRSYLGLIFGFILSMAVISGGIYLVANGHDWAGGVLIGLDIIGLAGVFVYGSRSRRAERERMAEKMSLRQVTASDEQEQTS